MLVGVVSDSHGDVEMLRRAAELLRESGAQMVLHCGDVGDEDCIDLLAGLNAHVVFGNCDFGRGQLAGYAQRLGVGCVDPSGVVVAEGKRIGLTHGDRPGLVQALADAKVAYLFTGHTHVPHDRQIGGVRWLNPGALHRAAVKTCGLLNVASGEWRLIEVV